MHARGSVHRRQSPCTTCPAQYARRAVLQKIWAAEKDELHASRSMPGRSTAMPRTRRESRRQGSWGDSCLPRVAPDGLAGWHPSSGIHVWIVRFTEDFLIQLRATHCYEGEYMRLRTALASVPARTSAVLDALSSLLFWPHHTTLFSMGPSSGPPAWRMTSPTSTNPSLQGSPGGCGCSWLRDGQL